MFNQRIGWCLFVVFACPSFLSGMQNTEPTRTEYVANIIGALAQKIITNDLNTYFKRLPLLKALHVIVHNECKNIDISGKDAVERAAISFYQNYVSQKEYSNFLPSAIKRYKKRVVFLYSDGMQEHFCLISNGRWRLILWNLSLQPYNVVDNILGNVQNYLPGAVEIKANEEFKHPESVASGSTSSSSSGSADPIVAMNNQSGLQTEMTSVVPIE